MRAVPIICALEGAPGSDEGTADQSQTYNSNLDNFIGAGTFDVNFGITNTSLIGPNPDIFTEGGTPFQWATNSSTRTFTIEYTYETVPIPGTLALTALGLAALGASRRRNKNKGR